MKHTLRSKNLPLVATGIPDPFCNPKTKTTSSLKGFLTLVMMVMGMGVSWGQTSTQNFGTTTGSNTSSTGSTSLISNPTSGTTYARAGVTVPNAPVVLATASNPLGTTGAYARCVASTSTSVTKMSPWVGYNGGTEFYTSFKVLFGDASAGSTASSGLWSFYQGNGGMYSDASNFSGNQVFTGLTFTYGAGGALSLSYRASGSSSTTGLTTTSFSSGTIYTIEIVGNNKASGTINYSYMGSAKTVAVQKFDLYVNGTLIGNDLAEAQLPANTAINSGTFIGISSTSNVANIFVDDVVVYNAVPATIGTAPTTPSLAITGTTGHGSVCPSSPATTQTYTITNTGTAASNVVVSSSDAQFVVSNLSSTSIGATNGTATYDVTFTPSSSGAKTATITVYYDTSTSATTSSLTGTGTTPVTQAVTSSTPTPISYTSATLKGTVNALGVCPSSTQKGFVYSLTSTNSDPVNAGSGVTTTSVTSLVTGAYILALTGLTAESSYTFKAYIYDGTTYTYGASTTFSTLTLTAPGAPTIGTATFSGNTANVPFTAPANGGSTIISYTATSSPGGITGTLTQAGSGTITVSGLTLGQAYTFTVTATNAIGTGSASSASNSITPNYCTPTSGTTTTGITNVTFNTINNTTTGSGAGGFKNYTSFSTTLTQGSTYNLSVSVNTGGNYTNNQKVWIDWNQDGVFNTTAGTANGLGEEYSLGTAFNQTNGISSLCPLSVTVPSGARIGSTRMRVSSKYNGYTTSCAQEIDGEFEDYTIIFTNNIWTGTTSNSWNTSTNWSLGSVPLSTDYDYITISSGSPEMDVDYTLASGRTLTISGTGTLTINPTKTLTIAGTADFGGKSVTIKSDATGTGTIGKVTGTLTGATNVTVERYIPAKRAWRALTAPVSTTTSIFANWQEDGVNSGAGNGVNGLEIWSQSGGNGLAAGGSSNSLLNYNAEDDIWSGIPATNGTGSMMYFDKNKPFMAFVTGPYGSGNITSNSAETTLRATGSLFTGNQTYTSAAGKYNFIGNPYASTINPVTMLADTDNSAFGGNIWVWDANASGVNAVGTYNLFNNGTYTNVTSNTAVATGTQIQSGQAFFVKSTNGGTFTIKETHKGTTFSNAVFRTAAPELLRVGLYKQINTEWSGRDGAMTVILPDADANQTANKMANGTENVAFTKNSELFASQHHLPLVASDVLNVKVWNTTAGTNYKLKINTEQFNTTNLNATLEDLFTNARTPLTLNGTAVEYPFAVTTEAASTGNRFRIVFETNALGINNPKASGISILPNPITGDAFQVNLGTLSTGTYSYSISNALGQEVEKGNINNVTQNSNYTVKFKNSTANGMYIMKVTGTDNSVFTAKIIKQ